MRQGTAAGHRQQARMSRARARNRRAGCRPPGMVVDGQHVAEVSASRWTSASKLLCATSGGSDRPPCAPARSSRPRPAPARPGLVGSRPANQAMTAASARSRSAFGGGWRPAAGSRPARAGRAPLVEAHRSALVSISAQATAFAPPSEPLMGRTRIPGLAPRGRGTAPGRCWRAASHVWRRACPSARARAIRSPVDRRLGAGHAVATRIAAPAGTRCAWVHVPRLENGSDRHTR
jgi:hypothetical protein